MKTPLVFLNLLNQPVRTTVAILGVSFESTDCMATEWFRFALSRAEEDTDTCSLDTIKSAFRNSRALPDLVLMITQSSAFRYARW